ncbi:MAG: FecR family protein [Hyphomonadaceae bacterium]|nr:FecR family protein [Hyphomonadaceae bacterium]
MRFLFVLAGAFALSAGLMQQASAQEAPWRVTALDGAVRVSQPGQAAAQARLNEVLTPGAVVTTGASSRATLENGLQRVVMAANSRMTIAADSTDAMNRILQDLGSLFFEVDRRQAQHFRVETPLLAAVVKGTSFTVSVTPQNDVVHVTHGLVEVRALHGDHSSDVAAGATARVLRDAPGAVSVVAPSDSGVSSIGASLPAVDYAAASAGVVEGPGASGQLGERLGANANGLGSAAAGGANAQAALLGGPPGRDGAGGLALGHLPTHHDHSRRPQNVGNGGGPPAGHPRGGPPGGGPPGGGPQGNPPNRPPRGP